MTDDDRDLQHLAETEHLGHEFATGGLELAYDDSAPAPDLPPPGAPVSVVRTVRLPFQVDAEVVTLAAERGVALSVLLRDLITAGLEATTGTTPDPVTELRRSLDVAQRAAAALAADRHRNAA
ncbi:hypothetical protein [Dactylosporangium darangshiense]|uniref:Uncharacterized protein n=1 Tax=Dactylosporangium darangshiense TaxID=579108 RepID=A0ABP8DH52_9ACTN